MEVLALVVIGIMAAFIYLAKRKAKPKGGSKPEPGRNEQN